MIDATDAAIAEQIMGVPKHFQGSHLGWDDVVSKVWQYSFEAKDFLPIPFSSNLDAAFRVVEKLLSQGYRVFIDNHMLNNVTWWTVTFRDAHAIPKSAIMVCDSLPEAICK